MNTNTGSPVVGANITFTGVDIDSGQNIPISEIIGPIHAVVNTLGLYQVDLSSRMSQLLETNFSSITAHYAGSAAFAASDSNTISPPPY